MIKKQQGVALVIGLVVLMVLTIMGVSSMNNTTLQLQVAKNTKEHSDAFQATLSCIETSIKAADLNKIDVAQNFNCNLLNTGTATVAYVGCKRVFGASLEEGRGGVQNVFETDATGNSAAGASSARIVSAVGKPTPGTCSSN